MAFNLRASCFGHGQYCRACSRSPAFHAKPANKMRFKETRQGKWQLCATPSFNPQNVPDPEVMPDKSFGPEETVRAQLDALRDNDSPWPNHGVQTAYEFGEDIGGLERSRYFGYSKDLYHFDHFLGQFQNAFPELVGLTAYDVGSIEESPPGSYSVTVEVQRHSSKANLKFVLVRKDIGRKKGALMTRSLLRV